MSSRANTKTSLEQRESLFNTVQSPPSSPDRIPFVAAGGVDEGAKVTGRIRLHPRVLCDPRSLFTPKIT